MPKLTNNSQSSSSKNENGKIARRVINIEELVSDLSSPSKPLRVDTEDITNWINSDFKAETLLISEIRSSLVTGASVIVPNGINIPFDGRISAVAITLFQTPERPLRYISRRATFQATLNRIIEKIRGKKTFPSLRVDDQAQVRILLEVITEEAPVDVKKLTFDQFSSTRFEPGVTGLRLSHRDTGTSIFYMPTDAHVYSHMSFKQVFNAIAKKTHIAKQTNKIPDRISLLLNEPYDYYLTRSRSLISYNNRAYPLYRGYPCPIDFSNSGIYKATIASVDWLVENMADDGKFLYYYDGVADSHKDHEHPDRSPDNLYYNILRHSGGTITLLRAYELTKEEKYLEAADRSLSYLSKTAVAYTEGNKPAQYIFYNQKAKLGGTGVALIALMRYFMASGNDKYNVLARELARHLVARIDKSGEFIGYYVHPAFNNGLPIENPNDQEKKELFSFYYPGEALMGLALYFKEMNLPTDESEAIKTAAQKALDWLVDVRPIKYPEFFKPLPSDGWLMQAIEEWSVISEFQCDRYFDFVFNDANQLIEQMYTWENSPYYDYPGTFFYNYGDHAYADGARAEGLIAAYYLAKQLGNEEMATKLENAMKLVTRSLLFTANTQLSTYMYRFPEKGIGAFRFKLTRHWMRVDSVQHTACYLARLLTSEIL